MIISKPLVSILVAVYNIEDYVEECLRSICSQSYTNIEIIVVDDGSMDSSGKICDGIADFDRRVISYHKANGGLVSARKYALERARGEFVLQVDGDDSIKYDMVEKLLERALNTDADVVQCGFECSDGRMFEYPDMTDDLTDEVRKDIMEKWLSMRPVFDSQGVTKLCKKSFMQHTYSKVPDDCSYSEDWIFFVDIVKNAVRISSLSECLYEYRIRDNSLSNHKNYDIAYLIDNDRMMNLLYQRICDYFPYIDMTILERWYMDRRCNTLRSVIKSKYGRDILEYSTDLASILRGKKVIIYGAGKMGKEVLADLSKYEDIEIVAWADKNAKDVQTDYRKVYDADILNSTNYDVVVVAIANEDKAKEVALEISDKYNITQEKIIWEYRRERRCLI